MQTVRNASQMAISKIEPLTKLAPRLVKLISDRRAYVQLQGLQLLA